MNKYNQEFLTDLINNKNIKGIENIINDIDINYKNRYGYTPILEAIATYVADVNDVSLEIIKLILKYKPDLNITIKTSKMELNPLRMACLFNSITLIKLLIINGATDNVDDGINFKVFMDNNTRKEYEIWYNLLYNINKNLN